MLFRWIAFLLLLAPGAVAAGEVCFTLARGEGYGGKGFTANATSYNTDGEPCRIDAGSHRPSFFLSASDTDPEINSGPLANEFLYLWAVAGQSYGFWNGYVDYETTLEIEGVEAINYAQVEHDPPRIAFIWDVAFDPDLRLPIARLTVRQPVSVESGTWGRIKGLYR
jgi:hypothetical protein